MAKPQNITIPSRFHNLTDAALADAIGRADAVAKAAIAELDALKAEARTRKVELLIGTGFEVTVTEQIAGRLDAAAVRAHLGDAYSRFEKAIVSTVVRIRAVDRLALAA